jgi:dTDP-4-amino-4,6-dideoxygalactose transaminase
MRLFLGPNVQAFEREFGEFCGVDYAVGVSDGTNALYLALKACNIGYGDEVITVSHTFIATAEAITLCRAMPVFVDIDPATYLMDVTKVEEKITKNTRAILPVHLYGQCVDMDPILEIANRYNLFVIEDACQAHGAKYKGRRAGSMGTLSAFSFYFSKNLGAYGEGGCVTTNDGELAHQLKMLRDHGSDRRYYHDEIGLNGRLDELQAAVLRIKLHHLDEWNEKRRKIANYYLELLNEQNIITPHRSSHNEHVYHLYVIRSKHRDGLQEWLSSMNIGTGVHYPIPIHLQSAYSYLETDSTLLQITEGVTKEILSLPMYAELTREDIQFVVEKITEYLENTKQGE